MPGDIDRQGEGQLLRGGGQLVRMLRGRRRDDRAAQCPGQGGDMRGGGAAAAAEHGHAGGQKFRHQGGEFLAGAAVDRLAILDDGHTGIGLGDQGDPGIFPQALQLEKYLLRAGGAVQAKGVDAHALQDHQRRGDVGAGDAAAVFVTGEGDEDRLVADAADGQHRRTGVGEGHHGLDNEQVHAGAFQTGGLLGVDVHQLLEGHVAQRGEERAGGGHIACPQGLALHRLGGQFRQTAVVVGGAVEQAGLLQLAAVGTEGGGVDHLAAGGHIAALDVDDGVRMVQCPLLGADVACIAALLQLGAGGTVQNQRKTKLHRCYLHCMGLRGMFLAKVSAKSGRPESSR